MCKDCLVEVMPARQRTTLESGHYILNFKQCHACKDHGHMPTEHDRQTTVEEENDEYVESVAYVHRCAACAHAIASHEYAFRVVGSAQEYSMYCALCGKGESTQFMRAVRDAEHQERSAAEAYNLPVPVQVSLAAAFTNIPVSAPPRAQSDEAHDLEWN
jgi:hypothetical protein